mmetsp:Transcript_38647/g.72498  ORF Transcript_38647/g.72498 Transcript_38647/m.72498 type:complete len:206 (+) Transcript_38647:731-1348(+)
MASRHCSHALPAVSRSGYCPSRAPAAQYSAPPPTSMKVAVRPSSLAENMMVVNPDGQMYLRPCAESPSSMTERHVIRPPSIGGPSPSSCWRRADRIPSAPISTSASTLLSSPRCETKCARTPASSPSSSERENARSRCTFSGGRKEYNTFCSAAHRMHTRGAPCLNWYDLASKPPGTLRARSNAFARKDPSARSTQFPPEEIAMP